MKLIETSISIEAERRKKLLNAADELGVTLTEIFSCLLEKARFLFDNNATIMHTAKYQKSNCAEYLCIQNILLLPSDYEIAIGMRMISKRSLSLIVRLVIDKFLDDIIREKLEHNGDFCLENDSCRTSGANYFHEFYFIANMCFDDVEFWLFPWPRNGAYKTGQESKLKLQNRFNQWRQQCCLTYL